MRSQLESCVERRFGRTGNTPKRAPTLRTATPHSFPPTIPAPSPTRTNTPGPCLAASGRRPATRGRCAAMVVIHHEKRCAFHTRARAFYEYWSSPVRYCRFGSAPPWRGTGSRCPTPPCPSPARRWAARCARRRPPGRGCRSAWDRPRRSAGGDGLFDGGQTAERPLRDRKQARRDQRTRSSMSLMTTCRMALSRCASAPRVAPDACPICGELTCSASMA